ncbi:MAG: acetylxylan esterase [Verrucomicrobiales bacterium]|nr:acetylxylan esterase [Verrucomicrobiales bacterium]
MKLLLLSLFVCLAGYSSAEEEPPIYDEDKVPEFTLPDTLVFEDGTPVTNPADWEIRRAEILNLFAEHVYGHVPKGISNEIFPAVRKEIDFLEGKATLKEIRIHFAKPDGPFMDLLLIAPKGTERGSPTFLGYNFGGNHIIHPSTEISLPESWMRKSKVKGAVVDDKATEKGRGTSTRWPVEKFIDQGIALATIYYGDVDPDFDDGFENGVHALFGKPEVNEWGSIGTWAWALSRALDYLETDPLSDAGKVAVFGHSRLGKTSLWAGATDPRFAMVISNDSGCGGAALSRRRFGERVARINTSFPHWFNDKFPAYNENENALPVDQHQLMALIAPRALCVGSASEDQWADPKGEYLSAAGADPVYQLLGKQGLGKEIRYHLRAGKHDVTDFDWDQYINTFKTEVIGE